MMVFWRGLSCETVVPALKPENGLDMRDLVLSSIVYETTILAVALLDGGLAVLDMRTCALTVKRET
jgi:hypothetical protein